ncbi:MAG: alkaline phosphatase [Verrucomicrobiota bacterium]
MMNRLAFLSVIIGFFLLGCTQKSDQNHSQQTGSVIFIHPDGYSLQAWQAYRALSVGPDGNTAWDLLPHLGVYRAHVRDSLAPTSHAGGTIHAYGIKVRRDSYGKDETESITSASGKPYSIMTEASNSGIRTGIINSGHLAEPGTGAMLAQVDSRKNREEIVSQMINSGADIILGGGEVLFLPEGIIGKHGEPGVRQDGRNLIQEAQKAGYQVVYTTEELQNLSSDTSKVLGLFAAEDTYNDESEEDLKAKNLTPYLPEAPDIALMTKHALRLFSASGKQFFLMIEEEGTDNFGNINNASGLFEAYRRADECIATAANYINEHPDTLLLTAADSDASGMQVIASQSFYGAHAMINGNLPARSDTGADVDGIAGTGTAPFTSAPDHAGNQFQFGIAWPTHADLPGGVIAKAAGMNAEKLPANVDNTYLFRLVYLTLFGEEL